MNTSLNNGGVYQQSNNMHFSQANMHGLHGSQEFQQNRYYNNPHNQEVQNMVQSQYTGQQNNMIPDIILTGADESLSRQDFARDIGTAIGGMPADTFDSSDFFPSDEALKVGLDPLDFDGLQMLSDPNMVAADPDTENQFRLDKLDNRA
ncbi:CREB-regulated transcription coactivator 3-like [Lingula anatina]|uniref:CREB-regulated transcription coactivator 3-like n=1 Tax=Lingula anatina TaxID=7574 RepID=A0A1S3IB89_LINAN|nr:CREB-regulated transcription coactivator 3-like [Lingula anatina]|eukprot:XP_013395527.1 CREB-regulated transcription coactivator 3-like [Lingula anatina]